MWSSKHVKAFKNKPVCSNRAAKPTSFVSLRVRVRRAVTTFTPIFDLLCFLLALFEQTQTLCFIKLPRQRPDRLMAKNNSSHSDGDPLTWGVSGWGMGGWGGGRMGWRWLTGLTFWAPCSRPGRPCGDPRPLGRSGAWHTWKRQNNSVTYWQSNISHWTKKISTLPVKGLDTYGPHI